jgi:LAS seventeen-binding protein 5
MTADTKSRKYGNPHRQIRALIILDGLIQNAGSRFQRTFADEPLLERLRLLPREEVVDSQVKQKCTVLFAQWATAYKNTPGLERIANLYKELPKTGRPQAARAKVLRETETFDSDGEFSNTPTPPSSRSRATSSTHQPVTLTSTPSSFSTSKLSKSKKGGAAKPFNLAKERENMTTSIAQASIASTNLLNGLQLINRETERVSQNAECVRRFEACKNLRKKILYYIQHVESDEWIGSLVNANDELVKALTAYEITDRSIDDDSDSDAWETPDNSAAKKTSPPSTSSAQQQLAGLKLDEAPPAKPPRPGNIVMPPPPPVPMAQSSSNKAAANENDDDDDPFGDSNAAPTPYHERDGMTWREV